MSIAAAVVLAVSAAHADHGERFVREFMPVIERRAKEHYAHAKPEARTEAVAETVFLAWRGYLSALSHQRPIADEGSSAEQRVGKITPRTLAGFAIAAHDSGRRSYGASVVDAFSPATRAAGRARVMGLDDLNNDEHEVWGHYFLASEQDPFETARSRIDWEHVAGTCNPTQRRVLGLLVQGFTTNDIARSLGMSASRVSQIKRGELAAVVRACGYAPRSHPMPEDAAAD